MPVLRCFRHLLVAALCACAAAAFAQPVMSITTFKQSANASPDLQLPREPREPGMFMRAPALLKPAGDGPFPALLVFHTCGGVRSETFDWGKRAVAAGYVALVIDSLGPRGMTDNCAPPNKVPTSRGVKDAFQALDHLRGLPFVDKDRVGVLGFSWGAMLAALVSSKEVAGQMSSGARFQAAVALYPMCWFRGSSAVPASFEFVRPDTDRPLLVLMGDQDTETPAADCVPRLEKLKAANAPVDWHVYAGATHCWDCDSLNGFRKTDFQGHSVVYRYDKDTTDDSARRAFEFFGRHLASK